MSIPRQVPAAGEEPSDSWEVLEDLGHDVESGKRRQHPPQATRILELLFEQDVTLFSDETGEPHVRIPVNGHCEVWRVGSGAFKDWLTRLLWTREGKAPNADGLGAALNVIRAKARYEGEVRRLHNRVGWDCGAIWYDLGDPKWRAVRITARGWKVVTNPPILFRRHAHQQAQVEPSDTPCKLSDLLRFMNVGNKDEGMLLLVWLVAALVPDIAHPVLVLHGPQGSAKTTAMRILRRLVDPSVMEVMDIPENGQELKQQLSHNWAAFYDNIDKLPRWTSNAFCRAVTGEGSSKRGLYTDDEDVIYAYRRCLALNGINVAAQEPDLLDRSIVIGLDRIDGRNRKTEHALWAEFESLRPGLVSAMFNLVSRAMAVYESINVPTLPRMADFARWGCAIAIALGWTQEGFLAAYTQNESARNEEVLESNSLAHAIVDLVETPGIWQGTASHLHEELEAVAGRLRISTKAKDWPSGPVALSKRLNIIQTNLAAAGIEVCRERDGKQRIIHIRKKTADVAQTSTANDLRDSLSKAVTGPGDSCDSRLADLSSAEASNHGVCDRCDGCDSSPTFLKDNTKEERDTQALLEVGEQPVTSVTTVTSALSPCLPTDCSGVPCDSSSDSARTGPVTVPFPAPNSRAYYLRLGRLPLQVADWPAELRKEYEERVAILEYEKGNSRVCAGIWAALLLREAFEKEAARLKGGD